MKYQLLLILFCCFSQIHAQQDGGYEILPEGTYKFPEKKAEPINGLESFYTEFSEKFNFATLSHPNIIEAKCTLAFFVEKDGSLTEINAKMASYGADKEAIRLIKSMQKWSPAIQNSEIVRSRYELHLTIKKN